MNNELTYVIRLSTEGKPEVVELTDAMEHQHERVVELGEGLGKTTFLLENVNDQSNRARENFKKTASQTKELASETHRLSEAERNLESILEEANALLAENTLSLEYARLEYEQGSISQEQYIAQLQDLRNEVEAIDAPSVNLIRRQREINREINRLNPAVNTTAKGFGTANSVFFTSASALSRLNPALGTTVTTLISASRGMGQLSTQTGGVNSAFKAMTAFALSPAGVVAVLTLVATGVAYLINKYDLLKDSTISASEVSKNYVSELNKILNAINGINGSNDPFDTSFLENRLEVYRQTIKELESIDLGTTPDGFGDMTFLKFFNYFNLLDDYQKRLLEKGIEQSRINKIISDLKDEELNTSTQIFAIQTLATSEAAQEQQRQWAELQGQKLRLAVEEQKTAEFENQAKALKDINALIFDPEIDLGEDFLQQMIRENTAFINNERQIQRMRIDLIRGSGDEIKALHMELTQALLDIDMDATLSDAQRRTARELTMEQFARREANFKEDMINQEKALEEDLYLFKLNLDNQLIDAKIQNAYLAANALNAINQGLLGDSKAVAIGIFAAEKALSIAQVLMAGARESTQATLAGTKYLANPATWPIAAMHFTAATKIKTQATISAALIGAMALGEGASQFAGTGGMSSGSSLSASRVGRNSDRSREEFGIVDADKRTPTPIINLSAEIHTDLTDPKRMALIVKQGNEELASQTVRVSK